jgi:hypothetical protein
MKKQLIFLIRATMLSVVLIGYLQVWAQEKKGRTADADFHYYITNEARVGDSQIEFDLLLLNTDPAISFELATVQAGILINGTLYNGGNVTASIIPGSSMLNVSQSPSVITFVQKKNCIKIASKTPPGIGNGTIVSADPNRPTRVCRVRLTNSKPWSPGNLDIRFNFTNKPYPTKLSRYDYSTNLNTAINVNPYNCYSKVTTVQKKEISRAGSETERTEKISIYPNPGNGLINLFFNPGQPGVFEIRVSNSSGASVFKKSNISMEGPYTEEIKLIDLPDGTYTLSVINESEQVSRKFVIKK